MRKKFIIYALFLLYTPISLTGNTNNSLEVKNWKILYNQTSSIEKAIETTGWKKIDIPAMINLPYEQVGDFQFIWLHGQFNINSNPDKCHGITIENVYHSIVLYINKQPIGKRSPGECSSIHNPVHFEIQKGILKQGKNNIYIYLGMYDNYPGGISGNVLIQNKNNFTMKNSLNRFLYYEVPLGSALFLFILFLFNSSLFIWDRKEKSNLFAALLCLINCIQLSLLFIPFPKTGLIVKMNMFYLMMWISPIIYIYLIQALYNEFLQSFNKYFTIGIFILFLCSTFDLFLNINFPLKAISILFISIGIMFINIYILYRLNTIKPDPLLFYFFGIACIAIPHILWIIDIANYFFINQVTPRYFIIFSPIYMIILMTLVIRKVSQKHHRMKILYQQLKDSLNEEPPEKENKIKITSINQKKLDSIISFIHQNYMDDISREGLASSVDLSPDHLSRLFNSYTGKRINNFINELRIKEATRRLIESDTRVIDIAFSVGFESLTTFNRVFLDLMEKTPTQYRKENI